MHTRSKELLDNAINQLIEVFADKKTNIALSKKALFLLKSFYNSSKEPALITSKNYNSIQIQFKKAKRELTFFVTHLGIFYTTNDEKRGNVKKEIIPKLAIWLEEGTSYDGQR